jgi:hypothetical protein
MLLLMSRRWGDATPGFDLASNQVTPSVGESQRKGNAVGPLEFWRCSILRLRSRLGIRDLVGQGHWKARD